MQENRQINFRICMDEPLALKINIVFRKFDKVIKKGKKGYDDLSTVRACLSDKMAPIYFLRLSKVWSMLHHTGQWGEFRVKNFTILHKLFWYFFVVFHHKIFVFIIFTSIFDKVSNFRNSILTNQKQELVVSNCQRNCMLTIE